MGDVYEQMGIPKSKDLDADNTFEEADTEGKSEGKSDPGMDEWAKRQQEADDRLLRLECLKLVVQAGARYDRYPIETEKLFQYVTKGPDAPPMKHEVFCGTCIYNETVDTAKDADEKMRTHMIHRHPELYRKLYQ